METFGQFAFNAPGRLQGVSILSNGHVLAVAFAPSSRVFCFDSSGEVVWSHEHDGEWSSIAAAGDGYLLLGSEIARFDHKGQNVWRKKTRAFGCEVSRGGEFVITYGYDGVANVWSGETGKKLFDVKEPSGEIYAAAVSPDGSLIATGSQKGHVRLFDASTGEALGTRKSTKVLALAFSPDGVRLAGGHGNGAVCTWDVPALKKQSDFRGKHQFETSAGGDAGCRWCAFSQDGEELYTLGNERLVRVWSRDGEELRRFEIATQHAQGAATDLSEDGSMLVVGSSESALSVWVDGVLQTAPTPNGPSGLALTSESVVLAGRLDVLAWDRETATRSEESVFFPSDVVALSDGFLLLDYDRIKRTTAIGEEPELLIKAGRYASGPIACSSDESMLAVPVGDRVELWDLENSMLLHSLPHEKPTSVVAFSHDGSWVATADDRVRFWQLDPAAKQIGELSFGDNFYGVVTGLAISTAGFVAVAFDRMNNNFTPDSELWIVDPTTWAPVHQLPLEGARLGRVTFCGPTRVVVADSTGVLNVASATDGDWVQHVQPQGGSFPPRVLENLPVAVSGSEVAFLGADLNVNITDLGEETWTGKPLVPNFVEGEVIDESLIFEERLAGRRFLFTGRFESTSKAFREDTAKELGATVTKTANAKVTHIVVAKPRYGQHKPSASEKKIMALIDEGATIAVLSEQEMIDLFLATRAEVEYLLRNDLDRWANIRSRYRLPSGAYPARLRGIDLSGLDLSGAQLSNLSMEEAQASGASFVGVDLGETSFMGADLSGADLSGAKCWRTNFSRATLEGANLSGANLGFAKLNGADLTGANLDGAKLDRCEHDADTRWPTGFEPPSVES